MRVRQHDPAVNRVLVQAVALGPRQHLGHRQQQAQHEGGAIQALVAARGQCGVQVVGWEGAWISDERAMHGDSPKQCASSVSSACSCVAAPGPHLPQQQKRFRTPTSPLALAAAHPTTVSGRRRRRLISTSSVHTWRAAAGSRAGSRAGIACAPDATSRMSIKHDRPRTAPPCPAIQGSSVSWVPQHSLEAHLRRLNRLCQQHQQHAQRGGPAGAATPLRGAFRLQHAGQPYSRDARLQEDSKRLRSTRRGSTEGLHARKGGWQRGSGRRMGAPRSPQCRPSARR